MATAAQAAKHIFVTERHFHVLVADGTIKRQPRGDYDLDDVRKQAFIGLRAEKAGHQGGGTSSLSTQRTRLAKAKADLAERDNAVADGQWIRITVAAEVWGERIMVAREILLTLIGQLAAALGPEAGIIAKDAVYDALNTLADTSGQIAEARQRSGCTTKEPTMIKEKMNSREFSSIRALQQCIDAMPPGPERDYRQGVQDRFIAKIDAMPARVAKLLDDVTDGDERLKILTAECEHVVSELPGGKLAGN
jgi:hypothetical protein